MRVREARQALAEARARRSAIEAEIDDSWNDNARRAFRTRIITPLDHESTLLDAAMRQLDQELARALAVLAG